MAHPDRGDLAGPSTGGPEGAAAQSAPADGLRPDVELGATRPAEGNERVFESATCEDARMRLLEDDYALVARNELDDERLSPRGLATGTRSKPWYPWMIVR